MASKQRIEPNRARMDAYELRIKIYYDAFGEPPRAFTEGWEDLQPWIAGLHVQPRPAPKYQPGDAITIILSPLLLALRKATADDLVCDRLSKDHAAPIAREFLFRSSLWRIWLLHEVLDDGLMVYRRLRRPR